MKEQVKGQTMKERRLPMLGLYLPFLHPQSTSYWTQVPIYASPAWSCVHVSWAQELFGNLLLPREYQAEGLSRCLPPNCFKCL